MINPSVFCAISTVISFQLLVSMIIEILLIISIIQFRLYASCFFSEANPLCRTKIIAVVPGNPSTWLYKYLSKLIIIQQFCRKSFSNIRSEVNDPFLSVIEFEPDPIVLQYFKVNYFVPIN